MSAELRGLIKHEELLTGLYSEHMFGMDTAIMLRDDFFAECAVVEIDPMSDWVTVIQFFPAGSSDKDFVEATTMFSGRLGLVAAKTEHSPIPVLAVSGDTGRQLHIAQIRDFDRGTFVGVQRLADLPTPWPRNAPAMGKRSIVSLATRCMRVAQKTGNSSAVGRTIAEELLKEFTRVLDEQMDSVVALVANVALEDGAYAPAERLASFKALVEARLRVQRARTAARREGVEESIVAQLDSVIEGLDSAASALAGVASTVLGETIARADVAERSRERRITLIASALLLPALLFGLLGINWLPTKDLQEWWVVGAVIVGGIALGCAGWWLGNFIFWRTPEPRGLTTTKNERKRTRS